MKRFTLAVLAICAVSICGFASGGNYKNFTVSTYVIQGTVQQMISGQLDPAASFDYLNSRLKIDKIYIEVMRNRTLVDESGLEKIKKVFADKGVTVCGGLAYSINESNGYQGFDYSDPSDREFAQKAAEMAARHFDEILLDDYFFFNRKTDFDIKAKGDKSWTQYRLETMRDIVKNVIVGPAKKVNPNCKVIIKMANWYDQYQGMGNDTEVVPFLADGMYCGTESRIAFGREQHLQPIQSYNIMRFMDNLNPGIAKGGWVDQGGANPVIDRYAEQLWNTVFAKRPEVTAFHYAGMLRGAGQNNTNNRPWSDQPTSFNWNAMLASAGDNKDNPGFARIAGYSLEQIDAFIGNMGKPQGVISYTPHHATGDEYVHDYLGMIGVPFEIYPTFDTNASMIFLTEQAKDDSDIINKIKGQLSAGKSVCVTSGFVKAMLGKGMEELIEVEMTGATVAVRRFTGAGGPGAALRGGPGPNNQSERDILIPEIKYFNILTHDGWGDCLGISAGGNTYPVVLSADYSKGSLYILTIPADPTDLYSLPTGVLSIIRQTLGKDEPIRIETAPSQVALFRYDNNTFIVQNYTDKPADVTVSVAGGFTKIHDMVANKDYAGQPLRRGFGFGGGGGPGPGPATNPAAGGAGGPATRPGGGFAGIPAPNFGGGGFGGQNQPNPRMSFTFTVLPHSYMPFAAQK